VSLRSDSRREFNTVGSGPTHQEIQVGCIQRIADATEIMAASWTRMKLDLERAEAEVKRLRELRDKRDRTILGLKGQIGKLMKRIKDGAR
jgi:hypothetical protein